MDNMIRQCFFNLLLLNLMISLSACSHEEEPSAGPEDLSPITLTKDLSISTNQEKALIGYFSGVSADDDENIYAVDSKQQKIHIFSSDGTYLDSLGRRGKGPGEFDGLNSKISIQADTLYTLQSTQHRIDLFNIQSREPIRTVSVPDTDFEGTSIGMPQKVFPLADGHMLVSFLNPHILFL
jgi:hypothetical protein